MSWTRRQVLTSIFGVRGADRPTTNDTRVQSRPMSDENREALLDSGTSRYARNQEEVLIRHFFRDRRGGVFVDAGCYLPEKNSATCYLERHLGWTGLAIDAQDLSVPWNRFRPRSQFVCALLTERSAEPVTFFLADGSSTLQPERLDEEPNRWERRPSAMTSVTLDDVLANAGIESFDFLAINVNGADRRALAGLDLRRYRPGLIKIKCGHGQRRPTIEHLRDVGYRLIEEYRPFDYFNRYFTPVP